MLGFGLLMSLAGIAVIVLLCIWSFRIAHNLQALGRDITWRPGLTIVTWLLGGCTLYIINFLMLREHWKASDSELAHHDQRWRERPVLGLIVPWFVLTLLQVVFSLASGIRGVGGVNLGANSEDYAEALADRLPSVLIGSACGIASTILLILIVRRLTARHMGAIREA
jgi:lysylphosphatidylglycerol synthetase-like protein (DUF2156 family)